METVNAQGMGCAAAGFVAVLFDRLVTRSVITYAEANAILDDAVKLIEGRGETPAPLTHSRSSKTFAGGWRSMVSAKPSNRCVVSQAAAAGK
jgi:hypothetical protein